MPNFLGHTWFHYTDKSADWGTGSGNKGFVDGNNVPYADFVSRVREINLQLQAIDPACRTYTAPAGSPPQYEQYCKCTGASMGPVILLAGLCLARERRRRKKAGGAS